MIAQFPAFQPLSLAAQADIEKIVAKFPPYSDFNFVSLYSWNVNDDMAIADLNSNLVVRFKGYTSDTAFLSFIGEQQVDETIATLLEYARSHDLGSSLHLIPEHVIALIRQPERWVITEDRDNHDYLVLALKFSSLEGDDYASKRHGINKFLKTYEGQVQVKQLAIDEEVAAEITDTFHRWRSAAGKNHDETADELTAIQRLMANAPNFDLHTLGIYVDDIMVAFSIYEKRGDYAVGHFEKAVKTHSGLYAHLKHSTAHNLHQQTVKYINYEQDLGIEGLRKSKLLLHPESFLKKFTVSSR
jgi:hypothetical protein